MLPKLDPTTTKSWGKLLRAASEKRNIKELLSDTTRTTHLTFDSGDFHFDFSKNDITHKILSDLVDLANECDLQSAIKSMFEGKKINETENRSVLHVALRNKDRDEVRKELDKVKSFTENLISGNWKGFTDEKITDVVNIGIGGSDLGPKMVSSALRPLSQGIRPHYISNVDAAQAIEILEDLNPETTLFIIASKTFTTQETITNALSAKAWFLKKGSESDIASHFVAVSTNAKAVNGFGIPTDNMFEFWDWVGGRFSLWSVIGLSTACSIGFDNFEKLLQGALEMDTHFKSAPFLKNLPVVSALIGVWYNNFLGYDSMAILPYDHRLRYLPSYLQQVDMESNGKYINRSGKEVGYQTGPIIWGEPGTNGQHAFYQLIHQGTKIIPCDFIGIANPAHNLIDHHEKLLSNFFAQTEALLNGKSREQVIEEIGADADPLVINSKVFKGNRPSTSILIKELTPFNLGKLVSYYEHRVFVQGIIWNIFSFDQWGVELGKQLSKPILEELKTKQVGDHDESTKSLISRYQFMRK